MKSGIYQIICVKNNKTYIGSSNNISKRLSCHINSLRKNKHHSPYLQRSWNRYGESSFLYTIIEICNESELLNRENFYLRSLLPELNCAKDAISIMKDRKHSEETKLKMKNRIKIRGVEHFNYGKTLSIEHRQKIGNSHKGSKCSDETKIKQRDVAIRLNRYKDLLPSIELFKKPIIDSTGLLHASLTAASIYYNISIQSICDNLKGRSVKTRKGLTFKYA